MQTPSSPEAGETLGPALAILSLRLWLGSRALVSGIEKFAGTRTVEKPLLDEFGEPDINGTMVEVKEKVYGLSHYHGVPESLMTRFKGEPLLPDFALPLYDWLLGPLLLILGITTLIGFCTRFSLFAMGLLYTSLTFGLILLGQDGGVAWLAIHLALIALALFHIRHNRFGVPVLRHL
jgi:thiosulfate dehydrogenase (quinone) large subunit